MKTEWIALSEIEIGERHRPLDLAHVKRLAASIGEIGLQTPITVMARKEEDGWRSILVAGRHRLEALRLRGEEGAECFVLPDDELAAELWEIDENFARAELTPAQRADHHARRADILSKRGIVHAGQGRPKKGINLISYSEHAAETLGVSEPTVKRELARGKKIDRDVLLDADDLTGAELDEVARVTGVAAQLAKVAEIRERQEADKLNRYADKQVARSNAQVAAEIVHTNMDLEQIDALRAALSGVRDIKDFLGALGALAAGSVRAA